MALPNHIIEDPLFVTLEAGFPVNSTVDLAGRGPLHHAVQRGDDAESFQAVLDAGGDINARDDKGLTPLIHAIVHGSPRCARLCLTSGSDLEAIDNSGRRALHHCVNPGDTLDHLRHYGVRSPGHARGIVPSLIEAGADVDALTDTPVRESTLHLAVAHNRPDIIQYLAETGACLEIENTLKATPLHMACRKATDNNGCLRLLIALGADIHAPDMEGCTPLHTAYRLGHPHRAAELIVAGAETHRCDNQGRTPAELAVDCRHYDIDAHVRALITAEALEAELYARPGAGTTPTL